MKLRSDASEQVLRSKYRITSSMSVSSHIHCVL
jgi:hypothetical protein